jgi:CubicO group peptidase (beta-lactamase class C family)
MTKTVTAALIGRLVDDGKMSLDMAGLVASWQSDRRKGITLSNMLAMESGLDFNEDYGALADVTRMLYLTSDMADFVAARPLNGDPGRVFHYSSGDGVLLSRIWMEKAGGGASALTYPRDKLFGPLGMRSAILETDAAGTFVGSSYMYATARDWARFGLFLAHDGVWNGNRLLPAGYVKLMQKPGHRSDGRYSQMQTWLPKRGDANVAPDTFFMRGHDGQTIAIVPSQDLVIVRMGLTPSDGGYKPDLLFGAVAKAIGVMP